MNETDFSVFGTQFTASTVIVFLGHILERWFPKLGNVTPALKRGVYWLIGALAALGVHSAFTSSTGTLVVTGLTLSGILHGAWHWVQSVSLQEFVHGSTKNGAASAAPKP